MDEEKKTADEPEAVAENTEIETAENDSKETLEQIEERQPKVLKGTDNRNRVIYLLVALLLIAGAVIAFLVLGSSDDENADAGEITSYEECVAAGYPIMESYPEQCAVPGGGSFTRQLTEEELNRLNPTEDADEEPAAAAPAAYCGAGLTEYQNSDIGFRFCYPSAWGAVVFTDETEALAAGAGHAISFTSNADAGATVRTIDWQTEFGRGGGYFDSPTTFSTAFTPTAYDPANPTEASALIDSDTDYLVTAYCSEFLGVVAVDALVEVGGTDYDAMKFYYVYRDFVEGVGIDFSGCDDVTTLVSPVSGDMVDIAQSFDLL